MFRHRNTTAEPEQPDIPQNSEPTQAATSPFAEVAKDTGPEALRELMEKNLKWSQIIYEQNRKINRKLFWYGFFGWVKLVVILAPIIFAIIYLFPFVSNFWKRYGGLFQPGSSNAVQLNAGSPDSIGNIIKLLPLSPLQQEQLKQLLK